MNARYRLKELSDKQLVQALDGAVVIDRASTADVVARIAEFDARKLGPHFGCESTFAYCVERLGYSDDAAYKRIQAARVAREFPRLFEDIAQGRLNLSGVCLLAPHLKTENVGEVVEWATRKTNAQIRDWLAARFAPPAKAPTPTARQIEVALPRLAARQVEPVPELESVATATTPAGPEPEQEPPLAYEMRFTMTREDLERFRLAQALLSHAIPSGDAAAIYRRAIEAVIAEGEKRKAGATKPPRANGAATSPARNGRQIPAHVRRAVWVRDGGRCTYIAPRGHRCNARRFLEFDHIVPVARGGASTEDNVRLRCRQHNQDDAKHVYGTEFMSRKRREAAAAAAERRANTPWERPVAPPNGGP